MNSLKNILFNWLMFLPVCRHPSNRGPLASVTLSWQQPYLINSEKIDSKYYIYDNACQSRPQQIENKRNSAHLNVLKQ